MELEELEVINIQRVGQGNPDIITLNDLTSKSENPSSPFHYIEEEKKEEEDVSISNIDNVTTDTPPSTPNDPMVSYSAQGDDLPSNTGLDIGKLQTVENTIHSQ